MPPTAEELFLEQLHTYAKQARSESLSSTPEELPIKDLDRDSDEEYDSEGKNYLFTPKTPCPMQRQSSRPHKTGLKSHYFASKGMRNNNRSIRRLLDFKGVTSKVAGGSSSKKKRKVMTLPEYAPKHDWTTSQRRFLCASNS
jgi:hypothetical protein